MKTKLILRIYCMIRVPLRSIDNETTEIKIMYESTVNYERANYHQKSELNNFIKYSLVLLSENLQALGKRKSPPLLPLR